MARKLILDVDTGIDDALALMLAARSPELEMVGVTCVAGNVAIEHVTRNTLATLDLLELDVPVARGARKPLVARLRTATYFHGVNGLGNVELPEPTRAVIDESAASFLCRMVRETPGEIDVVAVGPLTNIALAIHKDPDFVRNCGHLIVMGGAVAHPGNATDAAEANFSNDPEAAAVVVRSEINPLIVDLGATTQTVLPLSRIQQAQPVTAVGRFATELLRFYGQIYVGAGSDGAILHDPLAVGVAACPEISRAIPVRIDVETGTTPLRGACVAGFSSLVSRVQSYEDYDDVVGVMEAPFNATLAREIQGQDFVDLFCHRLELD